MMPEQNHEQPEDDPHYRALLEQLRSSHISDTEALPLHMWLSNQASEHLQHQPISTVTKEEPISKQKKTCARLEGHASAIANQFSFLNQLYALDSALSQAFQFHQQEMASGCDFGSPAPEKWNHFRERLAADCALLATVSRTVVQNLKGIKVKKGRPSKMWRNRLFSELVARLLRLQSRSQSKCTVLATDIWSIYFPNVDIDDTQSAGKIISREKKRRKIQGQNAEKIAQFRL